MSEQLRLLTIEIPEGLKRRLKVTVAKKNTSMRKAVTKLIEDFVEQEELREHHG